MLSFHSPCSFLLYRLTATMSSGPYHQFLKSDFRGRFGLPLPNDITQCKTKVPTFSVYRYDRVLPKILDAWRCGRLLPFGADNPDVAQSLEAVFLSKDGLKSKQKKTELWGLMRASSSVLPFYRGCLIVVKATGFAGVPCSKYPSGYPG